MKRNVLSLFAGIALAGTFVGAQAPAAVPQVPAAPAAVDQARDAKLPDAKVPDVTVTGCLVQGSGPTVFILENAKASVGTGATSKDAKGVSYLLSATAAGVDLKSQVNHQVSVTGTPQKGDSWAMAPSTVSETPMPPTGQASASSDRKLSEKDLPKLSAASVVKIGDTCSAAD